MTVKIIVIDFDTKNCFLLIFYQDLLDLLTEKKEAVRLIPIPVSSREARCAELNSILCLKKKIICASNYHKIISPPGSLRALWRTTQGKRQNRGLSSREKQTGEKHKTFWVTRWEVGRGAQLRIFKPTIRGGFGKRAVPRKHKRSCWVFLKTQNQEKDSNLYNGFKIAFSPVAAEKNGERWRVRAVPPVPVVVAMVVVWSLFRLWAVPSK